MWSSCLLSILSTRNRVRSSQHLKFLSIANIDIIGDLYNAVTYLLLATADIRDF